MVNTAITIQCVNDRCKTLNPINEQSCNKCRTPIVKRYLWATGNLQPQYQIGDLIQNRFYYYSEKIVIDTQPNLIPPLTNTIPEKITPYLKLFSHRLYLPQIYGYIQHKDPIWLLEYESVPVNEEGKVIYPQLFANLPDMLTEVSPLRQLNWLWQITQLWKPLAKEKVLSSLFQPNNIKVNGSIIKIIELYDDLNTHLSLVDLGNLWSNWLDKLDNSIREIITNIVYSLQQKLITTSEELLEIIDQIVYLLAINYYQRKYQIITATDPGRKRKKNEDCCYPPPTEKKETKAGIDTLTIVCDGLGGQKAGEVASRLAISILQKELNQTYQETLKETIHNKHWTPLIDEDKILVAIAKANNKIAGINNIKNRKDRARMGTTVVMSMALDHEVYFAHVGDSRIYWITENSCHQVTMDDDLASREVRLGYAFYREVSKNPQNGALLQALGMEHSRHIKPHIQRLILDENCVFLLCSDGLSDFDRVEQYWQTDILPLVRQEIEIDVAVKNLMNIGVQKNGHDNVTVGLISCELDKRESPLDDNLSWEYLREILPNLPQPEIKKIEPVKPQKNTLNNQSIIIILSILISLIIGLVVWYQQKSSNNQKNSLRVFPTIIAPICSMISPKVGG